MHTVNVIQYGVIILLYGHCWYNTMKDNVYMVGSLLISLLQIHNLGSVGVVLSHVHSTCIPSSVS